MSTFCLDYELGSDAASGADWANAWKTISTGAGVSDIAPGDLIKIAKSPAPYSVGDAAWTDGPLASTQAITSSTNATPIVMTKAAHTYVNGDIVQVTGHATNTAANGVWVVANKTANTFELVDSLGANSVGNGTGGATGTVRWVSNKVVFLAAAACKTVDRCDAVWTGTTGLITVLNGTPTNGGTGYTAGDVLDITTGGTGAQATVTTVSAGVVTAVTLLKGGNGGYTTGAGKVTSGGTGSGCTLNITTVTNITASLVDVTTEAKSGESCAKLLLGSGVTKGSLIGYHAITPGTLAAYQKLSLWFTSSPAIPDATTYRVCLCSDGAGLSVVDEFLIPAIPSANQWLPLTLTKTGGGNLGASIASIAIYSVTSAPPQGNIRIDNFVACTTSGLNLQSLISKNSLETGGIEGWYGIQSIVDRFVMLDNHTNCTSVSVVGRGYSGTTETVATYARETTKTAMVAAAGTAVATINDSGTVAGGNITFSGGWDPVGGTQDGETFFDGLNGFGYGLYSAKSYVTIERLALSRYSVGLYLEGAPAHNSSALSNVVNCTSYCVFVQNNAGDNTFTLPNINNGTTYGLYVNDGFNGNDFTIGNIGQFTYGIYSSNTSRNVFRGATCRNSDHGVYCKNADGNEFMSLQTSHNTTAGVGVSACQIYLRDSTIAESLEGNPSGAGCEARIYSQNHDLSGYAWIFCEGGSINSEATDFAGMTGTMWRLSVTSSVRTSTYPLWLTLAQVAVVADKLVTVEVRAKKSHATNIVGKLVCRGGQIAGVASDVVDTLASSTDTETLSITFTPTASGVVEIECWAEAGAGTGNVTVDAITTLTQAA